MRIEADEADALGRAERDRPSLEGVSFGAFPDDLELRIGFHRLDRERDALHGEEPRQYPRAPRTPRPRFGRRLADRIGDAVSGVHDASRSDPPREP
jgi:hypothetical protein